jgi:type I restriction enzyme, S subunit
LSSPALLKTERQITDAGVDQISSGILPKGTVLLSSRAPIGYLAVAELPVSINQGFIAMVCNKRLPNQYVLHWTHENMPTIEANANGTTFMEVSKASFRPIRVLVPGPEVLAAFATAVQPLHDLIVNNLRESQTLVFCRDTLLPKLLSGELQVGGAA